jgi:tetratricopeptide (TPR) repeat protein
LWSKYSRIQNPRTLLPILGLARKTKNDGELEKVIQEIRKKKLQSTQVLDLAVSVASHLRGVPFANQLAKEFVVNGHYGETLEDKLQLCLKAWNVKSEEVKKFYNELKANPKLQTKIALAAFAGLCVKNHLDEDLQLFQKELQKAFEIPLVRTMMAKYYMLQNNFEAAGQMLEPLERLLNDPVPDHFIWHQMSLYFRLTKNYPKLTEMLSKLDLPKQNQETLRSAARVASFLNDKETAKKISILLGRKRISQKQKPYAMEASPTEAFDANSNSKYERAKQRFDSLQTKTAKDYLIMFRAMSFANRPFDERREFLRLMKQQGIKNYNPYFKFLSDYYEHSAGEKNSALLKDLLVELTEMGIVARFKPKHLGIILNYCILTKDKGLFYYYFNMLKKMNPKDELVQEWIRYQQTLEK